MEEEIETEHDETETQAAEDDEFLCQHCGQVNKIENCSTITMKGREIPICPSCGSSNIRR